MKYKRYSKRKKKSKKLLIAVLLLVIVLGAAGYLVYSKNKASNSADDQSNSEVYTPPTKEEKKAGDEVKARISDREKSLENNSQPNSDTNSNSSSDQKATVIITDAGQYDGNIEVRSFISDYYHDGTCTIAITKGDQKVSKSTPAYRDASTTICTNPLFSRSEFSSAGDWQVVVTYSGNGVTGSSKAQTIRIK